MIIFSDIKLNLNTFFSIIMSIIPFFKKKVFKFNSILFITYIIYILFFFFIFFINKKYFKIFFINKKYNSLNIDLKIKIKRNIFNNFFDSNKKNLYIYKFFLFKSKIIKKLNLITIFNN